MTRRFLSFVLLGALSVTACAQQPKQPQQPQSAAPAQAQATPAAAPKTHLKVGDRAPDFTLVNTKGERVSLSDFKGKKNVVLAFYVLAFTGG